MESLRALVVLMLTNVQLKQFDQQLKCSVIQMQLVPILMDRILVVVTQDTPEMDSVIVPDVAMLMNVQIILMTVTLMHHALILLSLSRVSVT